MQTPAPTTPWAPRRFSPAWRVVSDSAAALLVLAVGVVGVTLGMASLTVPVLVSVVLAAAVAAVRRRHPRLAVVATALVAVAGLAVGGPAAAYLVAGLIAVFTVAVSTNRRTTIGFALAGAAVATVLGLLFRPQGWEGWPNMVQLIVQVGFAAAVGDATRSRRAHIDTVTERARRAEATKESEARRRVAEERLSIARDLHDVVAHQIAVINLHAAVASQTLRRNPAEVEESLATIRKAARTVLGDIAALLNVLRAADSTTAGDRTAAAPAPGLAGLAPLIAEFAHSGLRVDVRVVGDAVELSEAVDVVAYRIIQEALTNAHKHGADGTALLQLEQESEALEITVTNTVDTTVHDRITSSPGLGLLGAHERVAAVQGALRTSYGPGPVHRLTARLPTRAGGERSRPSAPGRPLSIVDHGSP